MKKSLMVLAALAAVAHVPAGAQQLQAGTWTGTVTPPNESQPTPVTYTVALEADTLSIVVDAGQHGKFPFHEVKVEEGRLTFWFAPGPRVECALERREDGSWAGGCRDPEGGVARVVMVPPKAASGR